jgi:hypothetical protein
MRLLPIRVLFSSIFILNSVLGFAQYKPGVIVRECTDAGTGRTILNPNYATVSSQVNLITYHYVSATNGGWTSSGDDTSGTVNAIGFKPLKPFGGESCCDLRRGADHRFSDFVPDNNNNAVYFYYDAVHSAYVFRMRMGTVIPGSKGYSLLVDTDQKYGNSGSNADPNYVAKTTGINGNPGFELEIVLETGFRLAIYNIDGKGQPTDNISASPAVSHILWQNYSQVSMAATTESGDPDFFIDFYVPLSDLTGINITDAVTGAIGQPFVTGATQKLRIIPTTVMAPKPSTAGPISDIYGSDMDNISWYPPVCSTCNVNAICTTAPVITSVNGPAGTISGTWTRESTGYAGSTSAVITLYKNGDTATALTTTPATITCTSGGSWSATATGLVSTDIITAKAQGSGGYESRYCFTSNAKKLSSCTSQPGSLTITTFTNSKGIDGSGYTAYNGINPGTDHIALWKVASSGFQRIGTTTLPIYNNPSGPSATNVFSLDGSSDGVWHFNGGTSGNANSVLTAGEYIVYDSTSLGCLSKASSFCVASIPAPNISTASNTNAPTLTSPTTITTSTKTITGSWAAGSVTPTVIRIYLQGNYQGNATITGSVWTYSFNTILNENDEIRIKSQGNETGSTYYCAGQLIATVATSICSNSTPYIDVDSTTNNIIPGLKITGLGTAGGTVKIYNSSNVLKETVTARTDGTWSSTFNAATADIAYYVTLSTANCSNLAASATKTVSTNNTSNSFCNGFITGATYGQITGPSGTNNTLYSDETSISGTLSSSGGLATSGTFVKMYLDSAIVGYSTVNIVNNTWGPVDVSGMLYNGAVLTIGVIQSGTYGECTCSSIRVVCSCLLNHMPSKPAVDQTSTLTVPSGGNAVIKIRNPVAGNFYSLKDSITGNSLSKGLYYTGGDMSVSGRMLADSFITITSTSLSENTTAQVVATNVGGTESCTDTTYEALRITQVLPIVLLDFRGVRNKQFNRLSWKTADEINFNRFELERSIDGINYQRIVVFYSRGTNSSYEYSDVISGAVFYYRLKMIDNDEKTKYSGVVVVKENSNLILLNVVKPNPFKNNIVLSLFLTNEQDVKIMLVDAAGKIISTSVQHGNPGSNEFYLNNLNNLRNGIYFLRILANGSLYQEKMIRADY